MGTGLGRSAYRHCLAALLAGCGGAGTGGDDGARGNVQLQDENNYHTQSSMSLPTIETAAATDLDICWGDVEADIQCHDVAPKDDLDNVALLRFLHLSEPEVEAKLTSGELDQSEVDGYLDYKTDHDSTCAALSSMTFFGTPIKIKEQYVESDEHTYLLLFTRGTTPGVGARTMTFVHPSAASTNTRVDASSGCGMLDFSADLGVAKPISIPRAGPWVVDWRDLTVDGQGNELVFESIDSVLVGFYAGLTLDELQDRALDLELLATSLFEVKLEGGKTADLADARSRDGGRPFAGFDRDEDGIWLLGLMCSTCQNPSPLLLAVLDPTSGE